ncbi:Hypothetical protein R9X50_00731300 [Acrodontium crateriforme]|uniref:ATP-dependent RNA helicase n=1 Tax=Acrodontium crateriforme TaxID=150365 RepID=A0AAQ3M9J1_9PEZI|nr:Hypothetical protein R9X50_00731300 [Acrodontium crateriforme]
MADDGMLLNFELPSDAFAPKQTFKGGSWKDRLTARKSAEYGSMKARGESGRSLPQFKEMRSKDEELILPGERPNKRPRTSEGGRGTKPVRTEPRDHRLPKSITKGEYISSLFTYNQESSTKHEEFTVDDSVSAEPSNAPLNDELATFTKLGLSSTLASHLLNKMEIKAPTAIQRKSVEQLCATDSDAFIQAETGSGKTLAYLLPVVQRISQISKQMKEEGQNFNRKSGLFAIILAPTRELSKQISTVLENLLSCFHWIVSSTVIGGESKQSEKARLRKGLNILVATPGRLADHLNSTEVLDVSQVRWLVLDEGDRLMELGFENDIQKIVSVLNLRSRKIQEHPVPGLPERRTTVLCSATIKATVDQLSSIALKDPVSISADASEKSNTEMEQAFSAPAQLKQSYALVPPKQRLVALVAALKQAFKRKGSVMKCILFMSCADNVDFHFEVFTREETSPSTENKDASEDTLRVPKMSKTDKIRQGGTIAETRTQGLATAFSGQDNPVQVFRLHGSMQQATRTSTLKAFTNCTDPSVLVCTDVASRGLDLPNVDLVIEYDAPFSKEDHLHRVGRTARAGKDGRAMIFLMPGCEEGYVEILKEGRPRNLTRHDAAELLKKGFAASSGVVGGKDWEDIATDWQMDVERWVLANRKHHEQAYRAFQSHIRAYATHTAAERGYFDLKQLHLGHLAKAFALREKPSTIRVPGQRPGKEAVAKTKEARRAQAGKAAAGSKRAHDEDDFDQGAADEQQAKRMMRMKSKMAMTGASEFNLG